MLHVVRRYADSVILKVLFVLLIGVFMFWGIGTGFFSQISPVATVNGERILPDQVTRESDVLRQTLESMYGENASAVLKNVNLRQEAVNEIIQNQLIKEEAQRLGIEVSDQQLQERIAAQPQFQRDGRFDFDTYQTILTDYYHMSPAEFETGERSEMIRDTEQKMVEQGVVVSEDQAHDAYNLRNQKIALRYIEVPYSDYVAKVSPTEQQIADYYKNHQDDFREPERVQVQLVHYQPLQLAASVNPSEKEINDYYQRNLASQFAHPDMVQASHILISVPAGATADEKKAAKAKADEVLEKARAKNSNFKQLAIEYSDDPGTRLKGGDLGFFPRGEMIKPFEDAAFSMKPGETREVETQFGYHVIKLLETKPAHTETLAEARPKIIDALRSDAGTKLARQALDQDFTAAVNGATLTDLAKKRGLDVTTPPPFAMGEQVADVSDTGGKIAKEAFSADVGQTREIADGDSEWLIRVLSKTPSHVPPLKDIESKVRDAYIREQATGLARADAQKLIEQIKSPADFDRVSAQNKLSQHVVEPFPRVGGSIPQLGQFPEVADAAALLPQIPDVVDRVMQQDGNSFIFEVTARTEPSEDDWKGAKKAFIEEYQSAQQAQAWQHFVEDLKSRAKVTINADQIGNTGTSS